MRSRRSDHRSSSSSTWSKASFTVTFELRHASWSWVIIKPQKIADHANLAVMTADALRCHCFHISQRHIAIHDDWEYRVELQALLVAESALHSEFLSAARDVHVLVLVRGCWLSALRSVERHFSDFGEVRRMCVNMNCKHKYFILSPDTCESASLSQLSSACYRQFILATWD